MEMEIELNPTAITSYEMFYLSQERAMEISTWIADACNEFEGQFDKSAGGVIFTPTPLLKTMLEVAKTENEKNFVLYTAYTGIGILLSNLGFRPDARHNDGSGIPATHQGK